MNLIKNISVIILALIGAFYWIFSSIKMRDGRIFEAIYCILIAILINIVVGFASL